MFTQWIPLTREGAGATPDPSLSMMEDAVSKEYAPKQFLRQADNALLGQYFTARHRLTDINFDELDETDVETVAPTHHHPVFHFRSASRGSSVTGPRESSLLLPIDRTHQLSRATSSLTPSFALLHCSTPVLRELR